MLLIKLPREKPQVLKTTKTRTWYLQRTSCFLTGMCCSRYSLSRVFEWVGSYFLCQITHPVISKQELTCFAHVCDSITPLILLSHMAVTTWFGILTALENHRAVGVKEPHGWITIEPDSPQYPSLCLKRAPFSHHPQPRPALLLSAKREILELSQKLQLHARHINIHRNTCILG